LETFPVIVTVHVASEGSAERSSSLVVDEQEKAMITIMKPNELSLLSRPRLV
jgi:hypothetical protein